ncbi:hypothetical protein D3C76_954070 [compost metagenome]
MLAAQLESIAMQHLMGLGRPADEAMGLAAVEMEAMDTDNLCHPLGKDCQQGVKIPLCQQPLEQLLALLAGQRPEPLHLLHPLFDAMPEAIQ